MQKKTGEDSAKNGGFVQPVKTFRALFDCSKDKNCSKYKTVSELSDVCSQKTVAPACRFLKGPTLGKLVDFFNFVRGEQGDKLLEVKSEGGVPVFKFTLEDWREFLKDAEDAVRFDAFQVINKAVDTAKQGLKENKDLSEADRLQIEKELKIAKKTLTYIISYVKAYFRDGKFVSVELNTEQLKTAIKNRLQTSFPELDIHPHVRQTIVQDLFERIPKSGDIPTDMHEDKVNYRIIGKISETSFKTRGGTDYKFPAITATLNPGSRELITVSKFDIVTVGGELIRVILEAIGDSLAGVPGVTMATGCSIKEESMQLPIFDPNLSLINPEDFGNVEMYANMSDGAVTSLIGSVVRGVSWISLNNESLAVFIETIFGVIARKASEKIAWCGYCAARQKDPNKKVVVPYGIGGKGDETTVSAKFVVWAKRKESDASKP